MAASCFAGTGCRITATAWLDACQNCAPCIVGSREPVQLSWWLIRCAINACNRRLEGRLLRQVLSMIANECVVLTTLHARVEAFVTLLPPLCFFAIAEVAPKAIRNAVLCFSVKAAKLLRHWCEFHLISICNCSATILLAWC